LRLLVALGLVSALLAAACGSSSPSPESVVRAWSDAVNADDNERAANLFAPDAEVVQGNRVYRLHTHRLAVAFNASLPCSGRIVSISTAGDTATATFLLADRRSSRCDGPGQRATALFKVHRGKIVLWHQTSTVGPPSGPVI
jgi:limonene-1,2-epoxide hydrolase